MAPDITAVRPTRDYCVELTFADGLVKEIDLREWVVGQGGVFQPLESPEFFRQVRVNHELGTIEWPNKVDLCPEVLYQRAAGKPSHTPAA